MPFKRSPSGGFVSPSGRHFTEKQVQLYYATDGFTDNKRQPKVRRRKPRAQRESKSFGV